MATIIQLRRDTASNWSSNNPVLASGEAGIETDTNRAKIGNGVDSWNDLPYFSESDTIFYTNSEAMPEDVGGWEAGSTFDHVGYDEMWTGLLYPYQYPSFNSFYIDGQSDVLEVGDSIPQNVTFKWSTVNDDNIEDDSLVITDVTNSSTLASSLANDGTEDVDQGGAVTHNEQASHVYKIEGTNSKGQQFSTQKSYNWNWKLFYGESSSDTLDEDGVESLRVNMLTTTFARTYSFNGGGYKYLCYPTSFGTATEFKDIATNLDVPFEDPYVVSVTNGNGVATDYNVHRTTNELGGDIDIRVS